MVWPSPANPDNGPIFPDAYKTDDMICGMGAYPAKSSIPVKAGDSIDMRWFEWPDTHTGVVAGAMANCNGPCEQADKNSLRFFAVEQSGLLGPGRWATDLFMEKKMTWRITIPKGIKDGNYVFRHEIIALPGAHTFNGAQNYPYCVNLVVTGGGSDTPSGISAKDFYTPTDPGILVDINKVTEYPFPGPPLYTSGQSASPAPAPAPAPASSASAAPPAPSTYVEEGQENEKSGDEEAADEEGAPEEVNSEAVSAGAGEPKPSVCESKPTETVTSFVTVTAVSRSFPRRTYSMPGTATYSYSQTQTPSPQQAQSDQEQQKSVQSEEDRDQYRRRDGRRRGQQRGQRRRPRSAHLPHRFPNCSPSQRLRGEKC